MTAVATRISYNEWQLRQALTGMSQATEFKAALREWKIIDVKDLEENEGSETCLCGHYPIREIFTVFNATTGKTALIGSVCIRFFYHEGQFTGAHTIIDSLRGLKRNPLNSANERLVKLAQDFGLIRQANVDFYVDIWRKQKLTNPQRVYKRNLNEIILLGLGYTAYQALQRIKRNPTLSAGPKLINLAFAKGVFNSWEKTFYLSNWKFSHSRLSLKQQQKKLALNQKLIRQEAVLDLQLATEETAIEGESAAQGAQRKAI